MQLKYLKTVVPWQEGPAKIAAVSWSPNNAKLAVCNSERVILLFDEQGERKDKFSTKPVDAKYGKKSYTVKGLAFSPDSTKLAVGQTDNILFVYKLGEGWTDKKVICGKFMQHSAVTCLIWPSENGIVFGLADGKVRLANVKTNKSSTLYQTDVYVCALAASPNGKGFLASHADGSIVRYFLDNDGSGEAQGKICTHSCSAYALVWTSNAIVAAGCDKRVISYNRDGGVMQQFDFSRDEDECEFTTAVVSPSGQSVVVGSFDRLRVFNWNNRRGAWEEGKLMEIKNLYTIAALAWKPDGSRIVAGTLCGSVELFDCCLKRAILNKKFEATYVGPTQVIVKNLANGKRVLVKSELAYEIDDVKVMGKERFVVARTAETLLLGDMETGKTSEVQWHSAGNEKFYFDCENVALIFNAGELTLVEYSHNDILGSVRTEFMNPHLISVRINERKQKSGDEVKRMAYILDLRTIGIVDLLFGTTIAHIPHDSKIDWLELNETARKLLFRDKRYRLYLYTIDHDARMLQIDWKVSLLPYCSYVQWVPGSDVVVAKGRDDLCVWYNIDMPDQVTKLPVKGDVVELIRDRGKTEVIVNEGAVQASYTLDEGLIEFGTAMEDGDFIRAVTYLETLEMSPEAESMWKQLATAALEQRQLFIAMTAFAALNDVARVFYLDETWQLAREAAKQLGGNGTQHYKVRARLAIMERKLKEAERIYLEQNAMDEAIEMYQSLHKWDEALELATSRGHPDVDVLRQKYYRHLAETGQDEKAGELKEKEGDEMAAIDLYLKANLPSRAAKVITTNENLLQNIELVQTVAVALIKNELYELAGGLFEKIKDFDRALECYRRAKAYNRALELARYAFPQNVITLEEEYADYLAGQKQMDAAINHYIESNNMMKALETAVKARQWNKAVQIVEVLDNRDMAKDYYGKIAEHYLSTGEYERAERYFIEAGMFKEAVEMYSNAGKWADAHRVGAEYLQEDENSQMHAEQAQKLESQGKLKEAEKLYMAMKQPNMAIAMYKRAGQYENMMKLIRQYHPEHAQDVYARLAKELEESGRLQEAEQHYVDAGEWKSAVNMYKQAEMWEDAYRVAKQHGGDVAQRQVAYMWAKSLGGDSAVKLLQKFGMLEEAIDYAADNGAFDFAFELCRLGMKKKATTVHLKYAHHLEEEGRFQEAEMQFVQAGQPKEAVVMYVHQQDWDNAQRLAEKHCPEAIPDVYVGQARAAFQQKDFQKAESYLLRAQKPDLIVNTYKELGMWSDALRVCKEYVPNALPPLQEEYDEQQLKSGAKGVQSYLAQAKDWEKQGEYERAIGCYLKINQPLTTDAALMEKCWTKAGELAIKFLDNKQDFVKQICAQLISINCFNQAAELFLAIEMNKEAIDCLIGGVEWKKAKKVAMEIEPDLVPYVDERYKEYLRNEGNAEQLADLDVLSAIDMYIERGQWDKALDTAEQQKNPALLQKYVALYASELISTGKAPQAIQAFRRYGTAANLQNFNIYKRLIDEMMNKRDSDLPEAYEDWAALRGMLLDLGTNMRRSKEAFDPGYADLFDKYLTVAHYCALRSAVLQSTNDADGDAKLFATKISISLLRYTDIIPADKAFYEAGNACKKQGGRYENMAFVFLNHYLDLTEAIEEQNPHALDYNDLMGTDIPTEVPLPANAHLTPEQHDDVKEWVLAISVDKEIDRVLLTDKRGVYEASLQNADGSLAEPCLVTGYPILNEGNKKTFGNSNKAANKEDWNKLLMMTKMSKAKELDETLKFIGTMTDTQITFTMQ